VDSQRHDRSKTEEIEMDEEIFNMSLRKFLKKVGVTSQREIEQAVRAAIENGSLNGETAVQAKVTLTIDAIGLSENIDGEITLS
jgi:ribosomal protein L1